MGRLFFKLYSILVLAVAIYFVGIANLDGILQGTLERYFGNLAQGTFYLLEDRLKKIPPAQWPALVDEVNQGEGFAVRLLAVESLTLSPAKIDRLNRGEMVIAEVYGASHSYKRIENSPWVLEFPFEQSEYSHNQHLSNSTFNLIKMELREQPQSSWPSITTDLSHRFSFPVVLLTQNQVMLSSALKEALSDGEIVWKEVDDEIDFLYQRIGDTPYVIKIGPFNEPITLNYLQTILILVLAFLVALAVLFWVYPLWRDLSRLSVSAEAFGQGDFSMRSKLSKRSVLHHLAETFNGMASRIQRLISSHKELTNAVSHELRTPIARLRFGMEMLQSSSNESDKIRYIKSMNADIDELDQLVAELLTYARFDRDRPMLKFQRQEIEPWLTKVIRQTQTSKNDLTIDFNIETKDLIDARFEPRLLARALGNLLQNSQRYAQTKIQVTFTHDKGYYQMSVDDDGPGIPKSEREHIFAAFKRLDLSRDRDTGGYGLGLAIVQRISQWHGGDVTIEDSTLGGARFVIRWPVVYFEK
ncbi:MAG: hypothetical protein GXP10_04630 [Gammaproteobacteria bacterium]|nr:hypothetical protein [Gammaproteobacteria bacterium]